MRPPPLRALEGLDPDLGAALLAIEVRERQRYIETLAAYQLAAGRLTAGTGVWPRPELAGPFEDFCAAAYATTRALEAAARAQQAARGSAP